MSIASGTQEGIYYIVYATDTVIFRALSSKIATPYYYFQTDFLLHACNFYFILFRFIILFFGRRPNYVYEDLRHFTQKKIIRCVVVGRSYFVKRVLYTLQK